MCKDKKPKWIRYTQEEIERYITSSNYYERLKISRDIEKLAKKLDKKVGKSLQ